MAYNNPKVYLQQLLRTGSMAGLWTGLKCRPLQLKRITPSSRVIRFSLQRSGISKRSSFNPKSDCQSMLVKQEKRHSFRHLIRKQTFTSNERRVRRFQIPFVCWLRSMDHVSRSNLRAIHRSSSCEDSHCERGSSSANVCVMNFDKGPRLPGSPVPGNIQQLC